MSLKSCSVSDARYPAVRCGLLSPGDGYGLPVSKISRGNIGEQKSEVYARVLLEIHADFIAARRGVCRLRDAKIY